jgi:hypothetical protein
VAAFLATMPFGTVEEVNEHDRYRGANGFASVSHTWRAVIREKPPVQWSPLIGECLYNLRSSLDHIAWALAGGQGDKTAFPVFTDRSNYARITPGQHLRYVRKDAHAFIESLQPYHHLQGAKNSMLYLLDRLTNDDKHRELLGTEVGVVHTHIEKPVGEAAEGDHLVFEFPPIDQLFKDGATLAKYHTSNPKVHVPLRFTFTVAFDLEGSAHGLALMTCLGTFAVNTALILREFERMFFAGQLAQLTPIPLEDIVDYVSEDWLGRDIEDEKKDGG